MTFSRNFAVAKRCILYIAVTVLILLAVIASIGRYYLPYITQYRSQVLDWSSAQAGFEIDAATLVGRWSKLSPIISASDVHLGAAQTGIDVGSVRIKLNLLRSLWYRQPLVSRVAIAKTQLQLYEAEDGSWRLAQDLLPDTSESNDGLTVHQYNNAYGAFEHLDISDSSIELLRQDGSQLQIEHVNLRLVKQLDRWRIIADGLPHNSALPVNIVVEGRGIPNSSDFTIHAHASFQGLDAAGLAPALALGEWQLQLPNISGELWLDWADNYAVQAQGSIDARSAALLHSDGETKKSLQQLHSDFLLDMSNLKQIGVWLSDLHVLVGAQRVAIDHAWLRRESDIMALSVDAIELAPAKYLLTELGLMPEKPQAVLDTLDPNGWLRDVSLLVPSEESDEALQIRARLDNVEMSAWAGAPGGSGLSGSVVTDLESGLVSLNSAALSLHFPKLYRHPLIFDSAQGNVAWNIGKESVTVQSSALRLHGQAGNARGYFDLDIPLQKGGDRDPQMNLVIGLQDTSAKFRSQFIPYTVGEDLLAWLDKSIKQGDVLDGAFIYRGSIAAKADLARSIQLYFDIVNGEVDYDSRWPMVSQVAGEIFIDDQIVRVEASRGSILGLTLTDSSIKYAPAPTEGSLLTIDSAVSGGVDAALNVIKQSPVRDFVGDALDAWEGAGEVQAKLRAELPFGSDAAEQVGIEAQLQRAAFNHAGLNLEFDQINGPLHYTTQRQLYSPGLQGALWGKALTAAVNSTKVPLAIKPATPKKASPAKIEPAAHEKPDVGIALAVDKDTTASEKPTATESWKTVIKLTGSAGSEDIIDWLDFPLQDYFTGSADYTARLSIAKGDSRLRIASDLEQLQSTLPAPLQKDIGAPMPLKVSLYLSDTPLRMAVKLKDRARLALILHDGQPATGSLGLGSDTKVSYFPDRLAISGGLEYFEFGPWLDVLGAFTAQYEDTDSNASPIGKVAADAISIDKFNVYGAEFDAIKLAASHEGGDWQFQINGTDLAGQVGYNAGQQPSLSLDLKNIYLPAAEKPADETIEEGTINSSLLDNFYPADLPAMKFAVQDFKVGDQAYGNWDFEVRNIEHGIELHDLVADVRGIQVGGHNDENAWLQWRRVESQQQTRFRGVLTCGDLSAVLREWGFAEAIRSKKAIFIPDLGWYGSPLQFGLNNLEGDVTFSMTDGQFMEDNSAANALRLFSIFNFDTILRRLQFNFKDVFNRGLSYDKIRGGFHIENGSMEIVETLNVKGPSSRFQMTGTVDLENELVDTKMVATLPLTSNLPWVVALAGGLPAAVGVYVAGKIFQDQFDELSSASYTIKGKWDDPTIKLEKVFGDDMKVKKAEAPTKPTEATQ
ncbi:MAG: YhdP family phospholipid transporter [Pseudomonadales bacterium]